MKETFIVKHSIDLRGIRIFLRLLALAIGCACIIYGFYPVVLFVLIYLGYTFSYHAVDIDYRNGTFSKYRTIAGLQLSGTFKKIPPIFYILVKDTLFITGHNKHGRIESSNDTYEVALVGEKRFKLVLKYSYDKKETFDLVYKLQEKFGYEIKDMTRERLCKET